MFKKFFVVLLSIGFLCSFSLQRKKLNIVFIGDSITYGATLANAAAEAPPVSAVGWLRQQPRIGDVRFSNQGVSGFTTVDFLPATGTVFNHVTQAADQFYEDKKASLVFAIMLGTNDSAIRGPNGAPVSPGNYSLNLKAIIDKLLHNYPACKIIINYPIWYSPDTYNGSEYLQEGLTRLQSYFPEIDSLIADYAARDPQHVYAGDKQAFNYFKANYLTKLTPESGKAGTFYLHPNKAGAAELGRFWGAAIYKAIF